MQEYILHQWVEYNQIGLIKAQKNTKSNYMQSKCEQKYWSKDLHQTYQNFDL
jgi:hypothetical protein